MKFEDIQRRLLRKEYSVSWILSWSLKRLRETDKTSKAQQPVKFTSCHWTLERIQRSTELRLIVAIFKIIFRLHCQVQLS